MENIVFKNIVFAGTPEIASNLLKNLLESQYNITTVYTQPDRPKGRRQQLTCSPVKQVAIQYNIPVMQPINLKDPNIIAYLTHLQPDLIIVFAFGLIIPKEILAIPKFGCFNVHTSLLPKYRGASPIQQAILNGDLITGITIINMDEKLDTGDIWYSIPCNIDPQDTAASLSKKLEHLATIATLNLLNNFKQLTPIPQQHNLATYAHKITKLDAKIDWSLPASIIERKIRAFIPIPVAFTVIKHQIADNTYEDVSIRIWQAKVLYEDNDDGHEKNNVLHNNLNRSAKILTINKYGIKVATGQGILILEKLQFPGSKILTIQELINSPKYKILLENAMYFSQ